MMFHNRISWITAVCVGLMMAQVGATAEPIRVLLLTNSVGYEHAVVRRTGGELSQVEKVMLDLAEKNGMAMVTTKDAALLHPKSLKQFDVVMLYTTGDLDKPGKDGSLPMATANRNALLEWVKNGGGIVGTHTATDTFHTWVEDGKRPYTNLIGGQFAWHKSQQLGSLKVTQHPITAFLGEKWDIVDEWYCLKNVTHEANHNLLTLNTKNMKEEEYRQLEPYGIAWVKEYGSGRVFSSALGHRADVWTNPKFQTLIVNGIRWAAKKK